jgi:hypothetical protein
VTFGEPARTAVRRAGQLITLLERRGVVGACEGSQGRAVMTTDELDQRNQPNS